MGLLETARSFLWGRRESSRPKRREVDDKAERRDVEISKAEERLERLLRAEDDLFRQGRGK